MSKEAFIDLKKYDKKKLIGEGSFGKVYTVEEKSTKQIYSAKISKQKIDKNSPKEMLSMSREVNIISKLQHPSILKFIGYSPKDFHNKSKPVIITEYSTNGSLGNILELEKNKTKIKGWDSTKKLICIYGIAKGMEYLHLHEIIHRDLKPDNIFLDDYLFPKIADFGLSKINNDISISIKELKSTTGTLKGTPIYIAPEIWSSQEYSTAGDVYAFSLIFYEIISNEQPFKGYTMLQILMEIVKNQKRPEFKNDIPQCYRDLIQRCWSHSPKDRPTFHEIVEQLKNDPNFITDDIQKDDYHKYIDFIGQSQSTFDATKKIIHISDFIKSKNKTFQKVKVKKQKKKKEDFQKIVEEERIVETDEFDDYKLKLIDPSIFKKLDSNSKKLVIDAEGNEPNSLIFVARSFIEGSNNFPKDIDTGIKYFEYGITIENVEVMELYGKLLFEGDIIPKNEEKSVEILTKAANEFNSPNAKYELATIILSHQSFDINDKNENINYVLAKKYAKEAADSGNTKAMVLYSNLSRKNKKNKFGDIKRNNKESVKYKKLAADNDDPEGIAIYGRYIELGDIDMKPNPNEAIKCYQKAYSMNDMTGCAFLGLAIVRGIGDLEPNEEEAAKLLKLAMDNGNTYGMIYYSNSIIKDSKNNLDVYIKTSKMGNPVAFCLAGFCYYAGEGVEKDLNMAIKYFRRAIEEGAIGAAEYLADIYKIDHPEFGIKANPKKVKHYMKLAADDGNIDAIRHYAAYLAELNENPDEIKKYFKIGVKMGDDNCILCYGLHLQMGKGIPKNEEKAAKYIKMSADLGNKQAMKLYSLQLAGGFGVEKNEVESTRYKLLASDQDDENCLIQ